MIAVPAAPRLCASSCKARCLYTKVTKQPVQSVAAPQVALQSKPLPILLGDGPAHALVLWDIENVHPFSPVVTLPVQLQHIRDVLHSSGCTSTRTVVALNPRRLAAARASGLLALLQACNTEVIPVSGWSDAADVALMAVGYDAVMQQSHTADCSQLVLVCITQDTRFSQLLAYASDRGVFTIVVGPFKMPPRNAAFAIAPFDVQMQQFPLCLASRAAIVWRAADTPAHPQDLELMHDTQAAARKQHHECAGLATGNAHASNSELPVEFNKASNQDLNAMLTASDGNHLAGPACPPCLSQDVMKIASIPSTLQSIWINKSRHRTSSVTQVANC